MRQIVLDTETTGIGHEFGHRIIEIGCVEMIDRKMTDHHFHVYLNPERDIDPAALKVHGITRDFLADKPRFKDVHQEFVQFIRDAELIIHNASFDLGFLNAELKRLNEATVIEDICTVFDTLTYARKKHPGQRNNLDALCKRYDINQIERQLHGALLDAKILARVYLAMTGGQAQLFVEEYAQGADATETVIPEALIEHLSSQAPVVFASEEELRAHHEFIKSVIKKSGVDHWEAPV